jgi:hypothetical protein
VTREEYEFVVDSMKKELLDSRREELAVDRKRK